MVQRRRLRSNWCKVDYVPLLCIMMGLIGFMAVTTLGVGAESHEASSQRTAVVVQLAAVPDQFVPLQVRCRENTIEWQDEGKWRTFTLRSLLGALDEQVDPSRLSSGGREARAFIAFLRAKAQDNRRLSYQKKQYTLIVWVDPSGVESAQLVDALLSHLELPLRVGKLPMLEKERVSGEIPTP